MSISNCEKVIIFTHQDVNLQQDIGDPHTAATPSLDDLDSAVDISIKNKMVEESILLFRQFLPN